MARNSNTQLLALILACAALFAIHPSSAFHILQTTPSRRIPSTAGTAVAASSRIEIEHNTFGSCRTRRSSLLAVRNNIIIDDGDDGETPAAPAASTTSPTLLKRLHTLKCWIQFYGSRGNNGGNNNNNNNNAAGNRRNINNNRKLQHHRATKVLAASLAASAGVVAGAPSPALARTFADNMIDGTQTYSLRPGVTREQAEKLTSGVMPDEVREQDGSLRTASAEDSSSSSSSSSTTSTTKAASKAKPKTDTLYGDYDIDDDDDEDFDEDLEFETNPDLAAASKQRQNSFGSSSSSSSKAIGSAGDASKMAKSSFSGISKTEGKQKTVVYVKASLGVAVPVLGFLGARNFVQHRREKKQVEYSLKVMDEKRAELFGIDKDGKNITKTEGEEDEDDEDEEDGDGKPSKDGDDDDDDDDDDEEDDEPPARRRRSLPKPPSGPQGGGDGLGGPSRRDYDDSGDDDGPSEDDIRKLGDLFNK